MSKMIDMTNQDIGYWHVLKRAENDANGRARWLCLCTACGTEKVVNGKHLRSGASTNCGCVRMEKMRQAIIKNEEGKTYGYLFVVRKATEEEKPRNDRYGIYWNCTCKKCGRENIIVFGDYLRNGDTKSCGCIISMNESKIADMLNMSNITFKQQVTFNNLTSTGRNCDKLLFDFGIYNNNILLYLLEYDGIQHFKTEHFSQDNHTTTHRNDLLKNKYCFDNHIPLIRIPFDTEYTLNDLKLETTRFLLTPDNEKEYYESRA